MAPVAFIVGIVPLVIASGADSASRIHSARLYSAA